jgi:heavy-metal resistance protein
MRDRTLKFILVLSLALNVSMLSAAGYFFYRHHRHWRTYERISGREEMLLERVSLRPDQIKTIRERSRPFYALMERKRGEIIDLRQVLFFLLFTENPDQKKTDGMIDEINRLQKESQTAIVAHILDEKSVMDDKQREKFYEMIEASLERKRPRSNAEGD